MKTRNRLLSLWTLLLSFLGVTIAYGQEVGDRIVLKATHHLGVPLHAEARGTHNFERVPDATEAVVMEVREEGRWLRINLSDDRSGWIISKYIGKTIEERPLMADDSLETVVWGSFSACSTAVSFGARMESRDPEAIRIGTWNIRWFPTGCAPGEACPENETDDDWLACATAWMDLDILAVQEILDHPEARFRMGALLASLNAWTEGDWQVDLQECGAEKSQHVGFLWNAARVNMTGFSDLGQLNGAFSGSSACASNLRPGRYARVESEGGADFHLVSVHLDSGVRDRDYQNRRNAMEELAFLQVDGEALLGGGDDDIVVLGDLNTMGRVEPPPISAAEEIGFVDEEIAPGFRRLSLTPQCTEYFDGHAGVLDHVLLTMSMQEVLGSARVTGYCRIAECQDIPETMPAAYERLSDHCPIIIEVTDQDLDPE